MKSLAAKITLPFVALFALLLLALGWILAREILAEVEAKVEDEQRVMLEVAAFPRWPLSDETLRLVRDLSRASVKSEGSREHGSEFIVTQDGAQTLTTLPPEKSSERSAVFEGTLTELKRHPELEPHDAQVHRHRLNLGGRSWLMLATERPLSGAGGPPRRFYLLHPYDEIEQTKNRALWRLVGLGLGGLALAAALGLGLAYWIAGPVRRLAAAAGRVTEAGLSEPLQPDAFDSSNAGGEIGDLTRAFRSMIESLRRSQEELLKAERLAVTGKLAASVAHEIRNPLTSLRMTAQMLQARSAQQNGSDAQTAEAFRIVLTEIDRLSLAVEELLTFARPRPAQRVAGDLNALAADTLAFLEPQLAHAKIAAQLEADSGLPKTFAFDANKMRQVLVNLVLNAMQSIVRNGNVVVRTRWDGVKGRAALEVEDSGPGVPAEVREKIFDLFVSTKVGGGGLGLAVAKQIAEEHGGTIGFESVKGRTVFRVEMGGNASSG